MSTLLFDKMLIPSAHFGEESSLPPISVKLSLSDISNNFRLDEDDGLFINYGGIESSFPYRYQDNYDRSLKPTEYPIAILENEFLKAVFMPTLGGKLWSLKDKTTGKELLFTNSVVRPCNLAVRNAWLSGGIEWNVGFKGHHPFTCSPINTAVASLEDGTPVLRFYYFERIRCAVVQMDFFLPEKSKMLFARIRLTNPNDTVVPMYWWSNIAAPEKDGDRVIVPAHESYTAPNQEVVKIDIPVHNGIDISYPAENITCNDYFWKLDSGKRKYICQLDKNGYGLFQTLTSRLQGRKMFVWGNSQGGRRWMSFLTDDNESGRYNEIQCGIAKTQYECLPMPPHTVWEWLECYGAMQATPENIHGDWDKAQAEVEKRLDTFITDSQLEAMLDNTRAMAKKKADREVLCRDGWGELELLCREKAGISAGLMCEQLNFGIMGEEQYDWLQLLDVGTVGYHRPEDVPVSYQIQPEWLELLKRALSEKDKNNWYAWYLYGAAMVARSEYSLAETALLKSVSLCESVWSYYALSVNCRNKGEADRELEFMQRAYSLGRGNISLAKEYYNCLFKYEKSNETAASFEKDTDEIKQNERCRLFYAFALARLGRLSEAEKILCNEKGEYLIVPDVRECELTVTKLWCYIRERRGFTGEQAGKIPKQLDFRTFTAREGWF